jgi:hypothetical protein
MATATYEPIATTTLGSAAASYTFSSIPSTYTDLVVVFNGSTTSAASAYLRMNGDTASNYSATYLYGNGTTAGSGRTTSVTEIFLFDTPTSNSTEIFSVMNYANTTTYKTAITRGGGAANTVYATVGMRRNTAAVTSLTIFTGNTFITGSTFTLYGIKAA